MPWRRRFAVPLALAAALAAFGCGEPPDKEIQLARAAIETAKAADAARYAHDEFAAAEEALKKSLDAVEQRDYRLALNHALDARDRAQSASRQAATQQAAVRTEAERALGFANDLLQQVKAHVKAAEGARVPPRQLAGARRSVATAEHGLQEARTAFGNRDYPVALAGARNATSGLQGVERDLDAVAPAAVKRRK